MPTDRRVVPWFAAGAWNVLFVQFAGNRARWCACGEVAKNTAHHFRLGRVNLSVAAYRIAARVELLHNLVAIGNAAARLPFLDAPT
ncbi:hypothetical protein [Sphingomonas sp. LH128]|uniref:hypothetical protein n=1 Tax=Sphingomonas sp. LH128 TaxID=473781 RepID=UPI000559C2CC|nr:hypothetical protein [Sphingomonas sp. LH128]